MNSNLEIVKTYARGVMQDIAIQLVKHARDPHSTEADGNRIADALIEKANAAATMLKLAKRNAAVPIVKTEPRPVAAAAPKETPVTKNGPRTLREAGEQELEAEALRIAKRDGIDLVYARVKAQGTEAGRAALAKYSSPLRDEPIADAIRKSGHYEKHGTPGDAFDNAVRVVMKRDGLDYAAAMTVAAVEYEDLHWLYRFGGNRW